MKCFACSLEHADYPSLVACLEREIKRLRADPIHQVRKEVAALPVLARFPWPERAKKK